MWIEGYRKYWLALCGLANILAFLTGIIHITGILTNIALVYAAYYYYDEQTKNKFLAWLALFAMGVLYTTHSMPGISNLLLISQIQYKDSIPFDFWLNFDKAFYGFIIIAFSRYSLIRGFSEYTAMIISIKYEMIALFIILMLGGFMIGFLNFSPKLPFESGLWFAHNLFATAIPEEAFFRLFLQNAFIAYFTKYYYTFSNIWNLMDKAFILLGFHKHEQNNQDTIAIFSIVLIAICIFLSQRQGISFGILSCIASIGYSWIFYKTKRIEASITAHVLINTAHYILFSYPAHAA
jgi:hypothetical protein